jgi:ubiquinone/menaquinone biosynthesis C-methylase UbiE
MFMELKLKFNEVAAEYDKWRPTYVPELFADIIKYSGINQTSRALEVGIGTGQATLPFLKIKCHVTAIELGDELAAFSRTKFKDYKNLEVVNMAFEDYEYPDDSVDIIYSASAFHWIPEEVGYPKVYRLLKSGGTFARFANHPYKDKENEPIHIAFQKIYDKYLPLAIQPREYDEEKCKQRADISKKYGFIDVSYKLYTRKRTFDAESYVSLISTYSDHRAL